MCVLFNDFPFPRHAHIGSQDTLDSIYDAYEEEGFPIPMLSSVRRIVSYRPQEARSGRPAEYRLDIDATMLVSATRKGLTGHRTRTHALGQPLPQQPRDTMLLWLPIVIVEHCYPSMVSQFEEAKSAERNRVSFRLLLSV